MTAMLHGRSRAALSAARLTIALISACSTGARAPAAAPDRPRALDPRRALDAYASAILRLARFEAAAR